jgi:isopenicillin-N epimerase
MASRGGLPMLDRRSFLTAAAGVAGSLTLPALLPELAALAPQGLPPSTLADDQYWAEIRKLFLIPADEIYLNNGTCGSSPTPVLKAVVDSYHKLEQMDDPDPEQYPLFGYGPFDEYRIPLAKFVGANKDEIAILRNATEANAIMANALDLNPGDEVLMSDQEHGSGESPWMMRAKRYGIVVKKFTLPKPPKSPDEVLKVVEAAITPKTKVIFVSHITTVTGVVLPVKEISALARSKGIVSMIDGAQVIGMMPLNIKDIGCDMYSSSPHKWLMSPKGTGWLYVRDEIIDRCWSNTTTAGWDDKKTRAARFQQYGSANIPVVAGMIAAIDMTQKIGLDRIEKRERQLADYIHAEMIKRGAESWTSPDPSMRCALVTVNVPPVKRMDLENWLWKTHKIRVRGGEPSKLRLSTPYYLQKKDIDTFLARFDEFKKSRA